MPFQLRFTYLYADRYLGDATSPRSVHLLSMTSDGNVGTQGYMNFFSELLHPDKAGMSALF